MYKKKRFPVPEDEYNRPPRQSYPSFCSLKTFDSSVKATRKVSTHLTEEPFLCQVVLASCLSYDKHLKLCISYFAAVISLRDCLLMVGIFLVSTNACRLLMWRRSLSIKCLSFLLFVKSPCHHCFAIEGCTRWRIVWSFITEASVPVSERERSISHLIDYRCKGDESGGRLFVK